MRGQNPAALIMGSVQLGLTYGAANSTGKPSRETALRLVRRAVEAGVSGFDTARAYGDAEARLGEALSGRNVTTVTKLAPLSDLSADAPLEAVHAAVDNSLAESLAALKAQSLDCVLLHRAAHRTAFGGAIWRRLKERLAQGTVRRLGVSVQSPAEAFDALADPAVRHIQLPFNLFDWRWHDAGVPAALAGRPEVTVHARSVFLQGVLPAIDPGVWPKIDGVNAPELIAWLAGQAAACSRRDVADLCLAYVRGQDWIDGVVIGMETEDQLSSNLHLMTLPPMQRQDGASLERRRPKLPVALLDPAQWPRP